MTLSQLRRRIRRHNMFIGIYERGDDSYILFDIYTGEVAAPYPMTIKQIELWLDELDKKADTE